MGYIKKKIGDISNVPYVTFECDTVADVAAIDVRNVVMGSRCYVVDTGTTYALNSDGEWKEVPIGGGASSWNDLEDKPFYEETVTNVIPGLNITWDGNTSGLANFAGAGRDYVYKVSDVTPSLEQLQTATIIIKNTTGGSDTVYEMSGATIKTQTEQVLILSGAGPVAVVYDEAYGHPTGLYLPVLMGGMMYCSSITTPEISETISKVKTIDNKFLPEHLQFGEETKVVSEPLNIQWDGNADGLLEVAFGGRFFYKISDLVFTDEQLKPMRYTDDTGNGAALSSWWRVMAQTNDNGTSLSGILVVVRKPGIIQVDTTQGEFPETGLYFNKFTRSLTSTEPIEQIKTTITKIDPKYLPEALQFGEVKEKEVVHFNGVIPSSNSKISDERFIELGKEYVVTFDDVEYVCVAYDNNREPTLGGTFTDFSNYPFTIFQASEVWIGTEASGQHNLSIVEKIKNITTIDPKYLPQTDGGGIEAVHLYLDSRLTNASILHNLHYGDVEGGNYARFDEAIEMTKAEADELYNKWIRGMARIFVFESSLSNGGSENFFEVVQLHKQSINSTGTYYDIYGTFMRFGEKKEFKLA